MWHVIYSWPWATIWAAISALFTAGTACVAGWAMLRWRKQDELKVKLEFKKAISNYSWHLARMKKIRKFEGYEIQPNPNVEELNHRFSACVNTWLLTEDLLVDNKKVKDCWDEISNRHKDYLSGNISSEEILENCQIILDEKIVFN